MGRNSASDADSSDTDARLDTQPPVADRSNGITRTVPPSFADTSNTGQPRFFAGESDGVGDDLDGFVTDVTTIAQSQCEHATDCADVETLVCDLPIDHLTFAAHDSLAPYTGPYPLVLLVRACLLKEINGWDETALYDHLRAHPSLCQNLGFGSLPNQSTFWRAWNERFSERLRDAVQECADSIVTAARVFEVPLPDRVGTGEADGPGADDRPEHQLVAEKTDEVWQRAKPFVAGTACDRRVRH
jgi:putative transposase